MTWVIGASSLFGYGVMLSDVRVTFANGRTADLVKKAYPVGPFILAGFAGSVFIGFQLIESLKNFLVLPPEAAGQNAWKPAWVAHNWSPLAKHVFDAAPAGEKRLGSNILLVGVSPDEDIGAPEFRRVYIVRFAGPTFRPGFLRKTFTLCHIGSGGGVDLYKRTIRAYFRLHTVGLQAFGGPVGWASILGETINTVAREHPVEGVSPHVHILTCRPGEIWEGKNDQSIFPADGSGPTELKMPHVATTYEEFLSKCREQGFAAEAAIG